MNKEIMLLLAPVVAEDGEKLLDNYINCIYQKDFVICHWHQEVTDYVINYLP